MAAPRGNKYAKGITTNGKPPVYVNVEDFNNKVNEYFESVTPKVDDNGNKTFNFTTTGLALFLGFDSRQSLYDYRDRKKDSNDFAYIVKRALLVIENKYEEALSFGSPTGSIFALKNMGWKDKTEVDNNLNFENKEIVWSTKNAKKK